MFLGVAFVDDIQYGLLLGGGGPFDDFSPGRGGGFCDLKGFHPKVGCLNSRLQICRVIVEHRALEIPSKSGVLWSPGSRYSRLFLEFWTGDSFWKSGVWRARYPKPIEPLTPVASNCPVLGQWRLWADELEVK